MARNSGQTNKISFLCFEDFPFTGMLLRFYHNLLRVLSL